MRPDDLFTVSFNEDGDVLRCRMAPIDTFEGLGIKYVYPFGTHLSAAVEDNIIQSRTSINPYHTEFGLRDALWRTLVGNQTPQGKNVPESYGSLLDCALHRSKDNFARSWRGRKSLEQVVPQSAALEIAGRALATLFPSEKDYVATVDSKKSHDAMDRMFRLHRSRRLAITFRDT